MLNPTKHAVFRTQVAPPARQKIPEIAREVLLAIFPAASAEALVRHRIQTIVVPSQDVVVHHAPPHSDAWGLHFIYIIVPLINGLPIGQIRL